jgi:hypothetical protein
VRQRKWPLNPAQKESLVLLVLAVHAKLSKINAQLVTIKLVATGTTIQVAVSRTDRYCYIAMMTKSPAKLVFFFKLVENPHRENVSDHFDRFYRRECEMNGIHFVARYIRGREQLEAQGSDECRPLE